MTPRFVLIVVAALLPVSVTVAAPVSPDAGSVLRRSLVVMRTSIHTVHGDGISENVLAHGHRVRARIMGDCTSRGVRMALQFSIKGTALTNGVVHAVDDEFITLLNGRRDRTWRRSAQAGSMWHRSTSDEGMMGILTCPRFLVEEFAVHAPPNLQNRGTVRIGGITAWHLQSVVGATRGGLAGTNIRTDIDVATGSLYWLRYEQTSRMPPMTQHVLVDYSRYNVPIAITAPRTG